MLSVSDCRRRCIEKGRRPLHDQSILINISLSLSLYKSRLCHICKYYIYLYDRDRCIHRHHHSLPLCTHISSPGSLTFHLFYLNITHADDIFMQHFFLLIHSISLYGCFSFLLSCICMDCVNFDWHTYHQRLMNDYANAACARDSTDNRQQHTMCFCCFRLCEMIII